MGPIARSFSIRRHLILLVLAVMLPLIAFNTWLVYGQVQRGERNARDDVQRLARLVAADSARVIGTVQATLESVAQRHGRQLQTNISECDSLFADIAAANRSFTRERLIRLSDGGVECSSQPAPTTTIYPGSEEWRARLAVAPGMLISPAYFDDATKHWMVDFGYALRIRGTPTKALIWSMDLAVTPALHYRGQLAAQVLPPGSSDTLIDGAARVLARWPYDRWIGERVPESEIARHVMRGDHGTQIARGLDGRERVYGYASVPGTDWHVYIGIPTRIAILPYRIYMLRSLALGLGVTALVALLAAYVGRRIARPIEQLGNAARAASGGRLETRIAPSGLAEVRQVAERFNTLMSARQHAETELAEEKRRAEITLHSIGDAVVRVNRDLFVTYLNPAAEQLTGWLLAEAIGRPLFDMVVLVSEPTHKAIRKSLELALKHGALTEIGRDTMLISRDGTHYDVSDSVAPLLDPERGVVGAVLVFHDISETRELERRLSWQARHDALTGLVNRIELEHRVVEALDDAKANGSHHVLLYVDLDQFKVVNDTAGHVAGDELLRRLADILKAATRPEHTIARVGGDEFCLLLRDESLETGERIADRIRGSVQDYRFVWDGRTFGVGASIGLVALDAAAGSLEEVMNAADIACYAAKERGRNRVHVFVPEDETVRKRLEEPEWARRIGKAFEDHRFRLYEQAIVPVGTGSREPVLHEILVRLCDESGRLLPPMSFLPAAQRYNLLTALDRWVVRSTLGLLRDSKSNAHCSINLSGHSISDDRFLGFVLREFDESKVSPQQICFEITESAAVVNLTRATHFMNALRTQGCRFALDDFGIGISSLAYLRTLPVDIIKIDGRFVRNIDRDHIDHAMVEAIVRIGRVMHLKTVAEFVENERTRTYVHALGVDYAQGYGVSEPQSIDHILGGYAVPDCRPA